MEKLAKLIDHLIDMWYGPKYKVMADLYEAKLTKSNQRLEDAHYQISRRGEWICSLEAEVEQALSVQAAATMRYERATRAYGVADHIAALEEEIDRLRFPGEEALDAWADTLTSEDAPAPPYGSSDRQITLRLASVDISAHYDPVLLEADQIGPLYEKLLRRLSLRAAGVLNKEAEKLASFSDDAA